jgi:hypothetical protein
MSTELKWQRVRAGWYETGNEIEGAYVLSNDFPGRWIVSRWTMVRGFGYEALELQNVESAGTIAYAKELAEWDASC